MGRIRNIIVVGLAAAIALLTTSCSEDDNWGNPNKVCEAPNGEVCWDWICESDGCAPVFSPEMNPEGVPECEEEEILSIYWVGGRFVEVVAHCVPDTETGSMIAGYPHQGRLILCDSDADCPQSKPSNRRECVQGLCQNKDTESYPREQITTFDAEGLCFAGFTRAETVDDPSLVNGIYSDIYAACPGEWNEPCTGELPDYCWNLE